MTTQSSEVFKSEHPDFAPGAWRLYAVIRGEPTRQNAGWGDRAPDGAVVRPYQADPGDPPSQTTANWKGYTASFQLGPDGRLTLVRFDYDAGSSLPPKIVNETLQGDFYAVFKADFEGPRLYVPFRDGALVLDRDEWLHEASTDPSRDADPFQLGCHPAYPEAPELSLAAGGALRVTLVSSDDVLRLTRRLRVQQVLRLVLSPSGQTLASVDAECPLFSRMLRGLFYELLQIRFEFWFDCCSKGVAANSIAGYQRR